MKVTIDQDKCQGHGRCYLYCSEAFEPHDDYGRAMVVLPDQTADLGDLEARIKDAVESCPEGAISID